MHGVVQCGKKAVKWATYAPNGLKFYYCLDCFNEIKANGNWTLDDSGEV